MQKIRKKIKLTLLLFLSFLSLFVNILAGFILMKYNYHHFIELSRSHMEQQYQNLTQHMAVMGEYTRFFSENSKLIHSIGEEEWSDVNAEILEFLQSSNEIVGGRIYLLREDSIRCVVSNSIKRFIDVKPEELRVLLKQQNSSRYHSQWFLRKELSGDYNCLSYLFPIYKDNNLLAFFVTDVNWKALTEKVRGNRNSFWKETLLVRTSNKIWNEASSWNELINNRIMSEDHNNYKNKSTVISYQKLTQSEDYFVQIISLNLYRVFLPLCVTLSILFLISIIIFAFFIEIITNSIMLPLVDIQDKIKKTLSEVKIIDTKE